MNRLVRTAAVIASLFPFTNMANAADSVQEVLCTWSAAELLPKIQGMSVGSSNLEATDLSTAVKAISLSTVDFSAKLRQMDLNFSFLDAATQQSFESYRPYEEAKAAFETFLTSHLSGASKIKIYATAAGKIGIENFVCLYDD